MSVMRALIAVLLLAGCATTNTTTATKSSGHIMFEDFKVTSPADLAPHGWIIRTAEGWPGIAGALWGTEAMSISDGVLRMTATTDRTTTRQAQLCHQRKYIDGTYA